MARKWVYLFTEGNADMRELLGGKGANLAEMTNIGLLCDDLDDLLIQTEVQDSVHHARHGSARAGTNRYQKRVLMVAELLAGDLLHPADVLID